jgi:hypothetical protein
MFEEHVVWVDQMLCFLSMRGCLSVGFFLIFLFGITSFFFGPFLIMLLFLVLR